MKFRLYKIVIVALTISLVSHSVLGQQLTPQIFDLYVFKSPAMFQPETLQYFDSENIKTAKLMTSSGFNPYGKGVDSANIIRYMNLFYPNPASTGTCVIDWEDSTYYDLRKDRYSAQFNQAVDSFIKVIKFMKQARPKVKIGIFGLPFLVFYPAADVYNKDNKFDKLFQHCDFIAPEIYIVFPDKQIGGRRNITFIQHNLDIALDYAYRLNKPVIPFIWEIIPQSNQQYGGTLIPKDEYRNYARLMMHYKYNNISIKGFFLWTPSIPSPVYNKTRSHSNAILSKSLSIHARDSVLKSYYNEILEMIGKQ